MSAAKEWARLPVDDVGYIHPERILNLTDEKLRDWVATFEERRYTGWRNRNNLWRFTLGLDDTRDQHIIDYGCGYGIESLQFARNGNRLTLFDLTEPGLEIAERVLAVHGFECETTQDELPEADIFYSNGVLHHFPEGMQILADAPTPEARLMLYSDRALKIKGDGPNFWRQMDEVGGYADTYSPESLAEAAPDWTVCETHYIADDLYLTATLRR